jgi:3-deoxy-D-manno-octulosonic-acid transferase
MTSPALSLRLRILLSLEAWSLPLWRWALNRRVARGKETPQSVAQKLMQHLPAEERALPQGTPVMWGHAVGVGEVLALLGLFRKLSEHLPDHHFLLTSSSRTSGEALVKQHLPAHFHHQFAPIDHPQVMARFLDAWQPRVACWSETDLWPGMVTATSQRGIPMLMFNARLDDTKATRLKRLAWFYSPLLHGFTRLYAQNAMSAEHLQSLSLSAKCAALAGNIKALAPALRVDAEQLAQYQASSRNRPIWLLASSHLGEEEMALKAHHLLLPTKPEALLIIVPRDAFRGSEIAAFALAQGLRASLRSQEAGLQEQCQVYVADTMGELGLWYALSPVALVAGSLVSIGGHNPYEAIAAGCRVLNGPQIHNFSESYADLQSQGLAQTVRDADEIAQSVKTVWAMPRLAKSSHPVAQDLLEDILAQVKQAA